MAVFGFLRRSEAYKHSTIYVSFLLYVSFLQTERSNVSFQCFMYRSCKPIPNDIYNRFARMIHMCICIILANRGYKWSKMPKKGAKKCSKHEEKAGVVTPVVARRCCVRLQPVYYVYMLRCVSKSQKQPFYLKYPQNGPKWPKIGQKRAKLLKITCITSCWPKIAPVWVIRVRDGGSRVKSCELSIAAIGSFWHHMYDW